ncbi:PDR/VanB family oxidoreductase [Xanthobacter agilis]|uniref:PDR/VanB family oxidoreductase n=1 Tax=Xanthobacter agilis TaxID=47492 RepID=UPI00372B7017
MPQMTERPPVISSASDVEILPLVVQRRVDDRGGIMVIDLAAPDGAALPAFTAGAHVDLHVEDPATGLHLVRQYSLCGDPADRSRYRLGILDAPQSRGGSRALHWLARPGAVLRVGKPRNLFPLYAGARRSVLVGGGIGVTPLLAMAHVLQAQGGEFALHYCARAQDRTAFLEEIAEAPYRDRVHLHFDDAQPFLATRDLPPAAPDTHLYTCGPSGFMDWVTAQAAACRYGAAQLHREDFNAEVDTTGAAFEVVAARSGVTVGVPAGVTIAAALREAGVAVNLSCESGVCGTCLVDVLEGVPDHRDSFLTPEERSAGDQILICCSRARSATLVLDI